MNITLKDEASQQGLTNIQFETGDLTALVIGSGYRGTLDQLSAEQREGVRRENVAFIEDQRIHSVTVNVLYAQASVKSS